MSILVGPEAGNALRHQFKLFPSQSQEAPLGFPPQRHSCVTRHPQAQKNCPLDDSPPSLSIHSPYSSSWDLTSWPNIFFLLLSQLLSSGFMVQLLSSGFMAPASMPCNRRSCAAWSSGPFAFILSMYALSLSLHPSPVATEHRDVLPASSTYASIIAPSPPSSVHIGSSVFFSYDAPSIPVSLLKYRIVGHPPAPGLCGGPRMDSSDRLTSPKLTSSFPANALVTSFHAGACLRHQPHPGDAIQRTNMVRPASISAWTVSSKLERVSSVL
mmetsp:Transcript_18335/g.37164  ORF Transcript_18335/g.37164 Transcript_18335/m.37164 type:complete len:270 (+) Transcript_18335:105-914(+)